MIISHKHKFIFLCNGKTGTTSIEELLRPLQEGAEFDFGVITGETDPVATAAHSEEIHKAIAESELFIHPGARCRTATSSAPSSIGSITS